MSWTTVDNDTKQQFLSILCYVRKKDNANAVVTQLSTKSHRVGLIILEIYNKNCCYKPCSCM